MSEPRGAGPHGRPGPVARFNHVALSVPADLLGQTGRDELCAFYGDVFGWYELPTQTTDRQQLVLQVLPFDQFVFLVADDTPMVAPPGDHFGVQVDDRRDLEAMHERAVAWSDRDDRVEIWAPQVDDFDVVKLHAFYLRFLLPMRVEVQFFELVGT